MLGSQLSAIGLKQLPLKPSLLLQAATLLYVREDARVLGLSSKLAEVLQTTVAPVALGGKQGQSGIDLACYDSSTQVVAVFLLHFGIIVLPA